MLTAALLLVVTGCSSIPGADPSGHLDSSSALNAAVRSLCNATAFAAPTAAVASAVVGSPALAAPPIIVPRDAVLDLAGGVYRMDAPLVVDRTVQCTGKLRVRGGTLLAGAALGALGADEEGAAAGGAVGADGALSAMLSCSTSKLQLQWKRWRRTQ